MFRLETITRKTLGLLYAQNHGEGETAKSLSDAITELDSMMNQCEWANRLLNLGLGAELMG